MKKFILLVILACPLLSFSVFGENPFEKDKNFKFIMQPVGYTITHDYKLNGVDYTVALTVALDNFCKTIDKCDASLSDKKEALDWAQEHLLATINNRHLSSYDFIVLDEVNRCQKQLSAKLDRLKVKSLESLESSASSESSESSDSPESSDE